ncbi:hypothetical protein C0J52_01888 [Blattella germanica]|nr:hypothetical protein C0J52_01888 [Blattella germanica]
MTQVSSAESDTVTKKPETTTEHEKTREKKERIRPATKVVIRRLPPSLTKESFINQISPLPDHDYLYFVRPDKSLGPFAYSRAYINFVKQDDIFTFKEQFDNYTFMDKKGNEYPAVVEFSPFQRLPKKRLGRKKDPKMEKKITTTPLLDFLRQRKAERQRMRDERREERRRKDQERKRLKDADRDRRRGTGKPEANTVRDTSSDSILKVLRNPEHEKEAKDDSNKGNKENKEKTQPQGTKKREDERQRINSRDKERERKERQIQDNRQRENKSHSSVKSYREDRQKQMEIRAQRKLPEDQRKKSNFDRGLGHSKTSENRQNQESDKVQNTSKTSDTRRSQEFERSSSKLSDTRRSQEFERNHSSTKTSESRKSQEYDRQSHNNRETEHRKHYQSSDQRKTSNEKYQSHTKDSDKQSRENDHRKTYKDTDSKRCERTQGYNKDGDHKRNTYVKSSRNYNEIDSKKNSDYKFGHKESEQKPNNENHEESTKPEKQDESKKWEQMGAKPKKKTSIDVMDKHDDKDDKMKDSVMNTEKPVNEFVRRNSLDSEDYKDNNAKSVDIETQNDVDKEKSESINEINQLDYESIENDNKSDSSDAVKQETNNTEDQSKSKIEDDSKTKSTREYRYGAKPSQRRGSLDSGDHESEVQGSKGMSRSATGSDWSMDTKLKRNHSLDLEGDSSWDIHNGQGDGFTKTSSSSEKNASESRKDRDDKGETPASGTDGDAKRDPRLERRIRNKVMLGGGVFITNKKVRLCK